MALIMQLNLLGLEGLVCLRRKESTLDPNDLMLTAVRATIVYFFVLFVIRILGKREVGAISALDLIVALTIGEVVDEAIFGDVSMVKGLVAISAVAFWHIVNAWGTYKNDVIRRLTESEPTVLVENGQIQRNALAKERLSEEELHSQLRAQGVERLEEVKKATLEPDGKTSVLRQDWAKPVEKGDLQRLRAQGPA